MAKTVTYRDFLRDEFEKVIAALPLNELQLSYLRLRWLDQVLWMESRAQSARSRYYSLRAVAVVGGLIVPALVGINFQSVNADALRIVTVIISLVAAISTAVESLFHYGENWRQYRATVEFLKVEGWRYFELADKYQKLKTHAKAFDVFTQEIEAIIQSNVKTYREITKEKGSADQNP